MFLPDFISCSFSYPLQKCIDQCFVNKHFFLLNLFSLGIIDDPKKSQRDLHKEQTGNMIYSFLSKHMWENHVKSVRIEIWVASK